MNVTMMQRATARSERGATIFVALLLMLVCIALCAVVISAASAVAGHFKDRAENDQRYYAVTSAARMFEASLGADGELKISGFPTVTQTYAVNERTGLAGAIEGDAYNGTPKINPADANAFSTVSKSDGGGYDFLPNLTALALYGAKPSEGDWSTWTSGLNVTMTDGNPITGYFPGVSAGQYVLKPQDTYIGENKFTYTLNFPTASEGDARKKYSVTVHGTLTKDWQLKLDFACGDDPQKTYHLYMVLAGEADAQASRSERLIETEYAGQEKNVKEITLSYNPKVTWRLQQIVSGQVV